MSSILLVAGDPSGDAHAARLIEALKRQDPTLTFAALGGPAMQRAGAVLLDELTQTASIGPFDAARHLGRFLRAKRLFEARLRTQRPDLVILVDFGDFNLPVIAPLAKRHGVAVLYYISPQLWAWGRWRLRYVQRYVDRMVVFLPFEKTLYEQVGVAVTWVGHPLVEHARPSLTKDAALARYRLNPWRRTVGLLPGSREDEVRRHLPLMLAAAHRMTAHMPGLQFLIVKAPGLPRSAMDRAVRAAQCEVRLAEGALADALQVMEAAVVASGTATLETALGDVPMVVVYRASWPTYAAARLVLRVPSIGLVNVVAGRPIVPELIQCRATPRGLASRVVELLRDEERCAAMRQSLREVARTLGPPGAVTRAALAVTEMLRSASRS
ncbi:MAG: lipid-A-disaccharide synthase [Candidatus Omnitrophica bacterium]|nr:lipid-A-disaccharide synthase [Candidatus Omnitrophota bacterium]